MVFEEIISAGIVSIVVITLLITLPGEAPLKRKLSKHSISKMFYYYTTIYLTFAVILLFWTITNFCWKSISFQNYKIIRKLEKRITKLLLLIIICIPCRYILRLMIIPSQKQNKKSTQQQQQNESHPVQFKSAHKRHKTVPNLINNNNLKLTNKSRNSLEMKDIKNYFFGNNNNGGSNRNLKKNSNHQQSISLKYLTPFQNLEKISTLINSMKWNPLPLEIFSIAGIFRLFASIKVHGDVHIPQNKPCLIIVNHALGHGFDVPMMVYILRKYCNLSRIRVLVSPKHFNYPLWCDLIYYLGGVPRQHNIAEELMKNGESIIMFAAKKGHTSMKWDNKRQLYLDLVHKYDYVLVPAVIVSNDDVINIVYNINDDGENKNNKRNKNNFSPSQSKEFINNASDTETDDEDENDKQNLYRSLRTIHGRLRRGYRKEYHLRFSKPVEIPKDQITSNYAKKRKKSYEYYMDEDDDDDMDFTNITPKSIKFNKSDQSDKSNRSNRSDSRVEVRFSGLEIKNKFGFNSDDDDDDNKYNDNISPLPSSSKTKHKRRWSIELEVSLKNAVEDAMTDGITEMYNKLKIDPNSQLLQTMHKKMKRMSNSPNYTTSLQHDIRSNSSNDIPAKAHWVE